MKKLFKKPVLLLGALGVLIGLGFVPSQSAEVSAQTDPKWCDWHDVPQYPELDGCVFPMWQRPCFCDDQC